MAVAFWSIELKKGKPVDVQPPEGYVLNMQLAAMGGSKGHAVVQIQTTAIEGDEIKSVVCTLRNPTCEQFTTNLVFGYDVPVTFSYTGDAASVFLSGYFQPGPEDDEDFDEEDYDEDDEDDDDLTERSRAALQKLVKDEDKLRVGDGSDDDDDEESSSDDDDEEEEKVNREFVAKMQAVSAKKQMGEKAAAKAKAAPPSSSDESESEDDESDSDSGSDSDSESEEEEAPPMKAQKVKSQGTVPNKGFSSKPNTPAQKGGFSSNSHNKGKTPQSGHKNQHHGSSSGQKRKH